MSTIVLSEVVSMSVSSIVVSRVSVIIGLVAFATESLSHTSVQLASSAVKVTMGSGGGGGGFVGSSLHLRFRNDANTNIAMRRILEKYFKLKPQEKLKF